MTAANTTTAKEKGIPKWTINAATVTVSVAALVISGVFRQVVSVTHYSCFIVDQETMAR
jgi:hypothetical protein